MIKLAIIVGVIFLCYAAYKLAQKDIKDGLLFILAVGVVGVITLAPSGKTVILNPGDKTPISSISLPGNYDDYSLREATTTYKTCLELLGINEEVEPIYIIYSPEDYTPKTAREYYEQNYR